jgi:hypothetical protein
VRETFVDLWIAIHAVRDEGRRTGFKIFDRPIVNLIDNDKTLDFLNGVQLNSLGLSSLQGGKMGLKKDLLRHLAHPRGILACVRILGSDIRVVNQVSGGAQ